VLNTHLLVNIQMTANSIYLNLVLAMHHELSFDIILLRLISTYTYNMFCTIAV